MPGFVVGAKVVEAMKRRIEKNEPKTAPARASLAHDSKGRRALFEGR